jgi:hypothetical protein
MFVAVFPADSFWLSGVLSSTLFENNTATAAYATKIDRIERHVE